MDPIIAFLLHHWALTAVLLAAILAFIIHESILILSAAQRITPAELVQMINENAVKVIDLRSPEEFKKGHIISSLSIPLTQLKTDLKPLQGVQSKNLVLVHTMNSSLNPLIHRLMKQNFKNVKVLSGGIQAWIQAELPLEKK